MSVYKCSICGYVHQMLDGLPGEKPTWWSSCPECPGTLEYVGELVPTKLKKGDTGQ